VDGHLDWKHVADHWRGGRSDQLMAKPRKANQTQHCSFCGEHKNDVPLIVTSSINPQSACCSSCALTIVHQTQSWAYGVFRSVIEEKERQFKAEQEIVGDTTDAAIKLAGG
jgi:hypothetical protein